LTERQVQFWEDVEDRLDDVEKVYASRGQDINRIRTFGKRRVLLNLEKCSVMRAVCLIVFSRATVSTVLEVK
jgi:hypothetical protein